MVIALCAGFVELPGDEADGHESRGEDDASDEAGAVEFAPLVRGRLCGGGGRRFGSHIGAMRG